MASSSTPALLNDSIDDKWKGEDGKGYYFVDDQKGVLVVGTEF